jgi:hypothetical protein
MSSSVRNALIVSLLLFAAVPRAFAADPSVEARLDAQGIQYEVDEDGDYKITYAFEGEDRSQLVFVGGGTETVGGYVIREVFAPAARVDRDGVTGHVAHELLADSRTNKLGASEIGGEVLYFTIKLPDSVDGAQLETALALAAQLADEMEKKLSGDLDEL